MSATERAVIYVDSGSNLSSLSPSSSPTSSPQYGKGGKFKTTNGINSQVNNYVIKIQIGEEGILKRPVRIDVGNFHHRQRASAQIRNSDGDDSIIESCSGQSSPRSDMTPPPRMNQRLKLNASSSFGSETSESDTESDISAPEYFQSSTPFQISNFPTTHHQNQPCSAAQFARREILGIGHTYLEEVDLIGRSSMDAVALSTLKQNLNASLIKVFSDQLDFKRPPSCPAPAPPINELNSKLPLIKIPTNPSDSTCKVHIDESSFHLDEFRDGNVEDGCENESHESLSGNFAGYRDLFHRGVEIDGPRQIMSDKGTIRGVRNRVRDGIATFLQSTDSKSYNEREEGRVVVYVTSMGVVRETFQRCQKVKAILRNLLVRFDERDCYMNAGVQAEIRQRIPIEEQRKDFLKKSHLSNGSAHVQKNNQSKTLNLFHLPRVFIEGQYLGGADTIEKLNETGELRKLLQPYKSVSVLSTCENCGGFRMLPCPVCNGSKKSVHRNHFTEEFVALKCMHCDTSGLVKCHRCNI